MRHAILSVLICAIFTASLAAVGTDGVFQHGAVVCSEKHAAEVGADVLESGGNAVDAACASALAMAVTYPQAGNIGGGGFALIYWADSQKVFFLDFRETAPAAATARYFLDSAGNVDRDRALAGPLAAGTPGTVAGLCEMHSRFGKTGWAEIARPALLLADSGFEVSEKMSQDIVEYDTLLRRFPTTAAVFFSDDQPLEPSRILKQPDLAKALGLIENHGRDGFYRGELAKAIADYCAQNGGLITIDDLEKYQPIWRRPIHVRFRELDIFMPGLPSSGGIVLGQILGMMDSLAVEKHAPDSPEYIHLFTEAARRAYADRAAYLGDPAFTDDVTSRLLDRDYIIGRASSIDTNRATRSSDVRPGLSPGAEESKQTTHLVTADVYGNIVSLTYTINTSFGSGAMVPGYGFLLNNEMDDFAIAPGSANAYGLVGGDANKIEGGKRMLSSMTPTIILKAGRPYLALGSPGGSRIITAVAQTILNYHVFGMSLPAAVAAPRFHHQWVPDSLFLEQNRYDDRIIERLTDMGHLVGRQKPFAEVMAIGFSDNGTRLSAAADTRREGVVAGY